MDNKDAQDVFNPLIGDDEEKEGQLINQLIPRWGSISRRIKLMAQRMEYVDERKDSKELSKDELKRIHSGFIGKYVDFKFYFVDGKYVRDHVDVDFALGGNPGRYNYIPKDEIWIEFTSKSDVVPTMIHEYIECQKLLAGSSYTNAHDFAAYREKKFRKTYKPTGKIFNDFLGYFKPAKIVEEKPKVEKEPEIVDVKLVDKKDMAE